MGVYKATLMKQLQHSAAATGSPALVLWLDGCSRDTRVESEQVCRWEDGAPPPRAPSRREKPVGVWPSRRKLNPPDTRSLVRVRRLLWAGDNKFFSSRSIRNTRSIFIGEVKRTSPLRFGHDLAGGQSIGLHTTGFGDSGDSAGSPCGRRVTCCCAHTRSSSWC